MKPTIEISLDPLERRLDFFDEPIKLQKHVPSSNGQFRKSERELVNDMLRCIKELTDLESEINKESTVFGTKEVASDNVLILRAD